MPAPLPTILAGRVGGNEGGGGAGFGGAGGGGAGGEGGTPGEMLVREPG